ncbi:hypothetical protein CBS147347_10820 [Aspergillus niger]|nr:hypothetical protein CBS147347_10820 [Aspergillus niger]
MGRVADINVAERFRKALLSLPDNHGAELVEELNKSGLGHEQAVVLYYMPALFAEILRHTQQASEETQIKALTSLMGFMRRTYIGAKNVLDYYFQMYAEDSSNFALGVKGDMGP